MLTRRSALRPAAVVVAVSWMALGTPTPSQAANTVAPKVRAELVTNGGGNRLDVIVRVATGRPRRSCSARLSMAGRGARLRRLRTGASNGRQWHWHLGHGAPRAPLKASVRCAFPDGKSHRHVVVRTVGPGPYPRKRFRRVVHAGSLRVERWTPPKRYDGSGGPGDLYPRGQCTWYVARKRPDLPYFPDAAGDAKNWVAAARARGIPTGRRPAVGAVAVFQPGQYGAGFYGHVAYVTAVKGQKITVTEANYGSRRAGSARTTRWAGVQFVYRQGTEFPLVAPPLPQPGPPSPIVWPAVDLAAPGHLRLGGAGDAVAGVGDVNGDGYPDVAVADDDASNNGRDGSGSVWVVFGGPRRVGRVELGGVAGFRIDGEVGGGEAGGDALGSSVARAGDVNGDGLDDIVIGANSAGGGQSSGAAYVVFGKQGTASIDLAALGNRGFRVATGEPYALLGNAVAGAGDVNGDGRADVVVGAPGSSPGGQGNAGAAYVVFGKADSQAVDVGALGAGGFAMRGTAAGDRAGMSVATAGDLNADGLSEVLVGAPDTREGSGSVYVVFGKADDGPVDLGPHAYLLSDGFVIEGADGIWAGSSVAGGGDVNGDGRPDLAIAASNDGHNARGYSGSVYVVFGKSDSYDVDLENLGTGGFRIDGPQPGRQFGNTSMVGDLNGDGLSDIAVGAGVDFLGRDGAGAATVIFGKRDSTTVDVADLGPAGYLIGGAAAGDAAGYSLDGAGDFDGDGRLDLIVGALFSEEVLGPDGGWLSGGAAYVVYGRAAPS
jgi:surface antigen